MTPQDPSRTHFEQRMRLRRAATCVAAARASLEGGRALEAQERLEEACRLDPEGLEARLLLEQLEMVSPIDEAQPVVNELGPRGARGWSHWVAVFVAVAALAVLAWLGQPGEDETRAMPARSPERTVPAPNGPAAVEVIPPPEPSLEGGDQFAEAFGMPASVAGGEGVSPGGSDEATASSTGTAGETRRLADQPDQPGTSQGDLARRSPADGPRSGREATSGVTAARSPAARPLEGQPSEPTPLPNRVASLAQTSLPAVEATKPPPPAAPSSAAPPSASPATEILLDPPLKVDPEPAAASDAARASLADAAADEEAIGQTLRRYSEAYERLDAGAASQVWPTVDARALARAFAGLESQDLNFDRCELRVDGAEAAAVCRGSARYVPKVGNREPIRESRQWSFRLRRGQDGWQIVRAEAR